MSTRVDAIPDSEADQKLIHRWVLTDDDGSLGVADSEGNADGTNNGVSLVTSSNFADGAAGEGDGSSHIETTTLGSFGSDVGNGCAVAFTIDISASSRSTVLGSINSTGDFFETAVNIDGDFNSDEGNVQMRVRDGNEDELTADLGVTSLNDGQPHRVVWNIVDPSNNDVEGYFDQTESTTLVRTQSPSNFSDWDTALMLFARSIQGTPDNPMDGIIDDVCLFGEALTTTEAQSYNNPWD